MNEQQLSPDKLRRPERSALAQERRRGWLKTALVAAVVALTVTAGFSLATRRDGPSYMVTVGGHRAFASLSAKLTLRDVVKKALPSVVNIASMRTIRGASHHPLFNHPLFRRWDRSRRPRRRHRRGLGSGVIVSADGLVITNNHVVAKADKIRVKLHDNRTFEAKVVGTDPKSDVAVLRLKGARNLKPITIGDSSRLELGDIVLAIGNPFGVGQTVTMGIVSAKGRANVGIVAYEDFIQTDAAINPGNSGGALINVRGELVGINTAILSRSGGYQGIGFAIPSNMAKPIAQSLLKHGKVVRGWLGVAIQNVDEALQKALRLPTFKGVLISDLDSRGPAKRAGLRRGDLIVRVDGKATTNTGRLRNIIASAGARRRVRIDFYRKGKLRRLTVRLAELPARLGGTAKAKPMRSGSGFSVEAITPNTRKRYRIPQVLRYGAVITRVVPGSQAARAGLRSGDVILEVNRVRIGSVSRFTHLFRAARRRVLLLVWRRGFTQYVLMTK